MVLLMLPAVVRMVMPRRWRALRLQLEGADVAARSLRPRDVPLVGRYGRAAAVEGRRWRALRLQLKGADVPQTLSERRNRHNRHHSRH